MHFGLSEEQGELAATVRSMIARRGIGPRAVTDSGARYDMTLWRALCDQVGVAALAIPEEYGGIGCSHVEAHLVLEELGAALAPTPMLGSAVLAARALLLAGAPDARERLLPGIAAGEITALCWTGTDGAWPAPDAVVHATADGDGWTLSGRTLALDAPDATTLLAIARVADGVGLFEVAPGSARVSPAPTVDQTLAFGIVQFHDSPATLIDADFERHLPRLRAVAAVAVTALQLGGARQALDLTVGHLKERVQFGRVIGSFQALKHRCADLVVAVESSRSLSWAAAWAVDQPDADLVRRAAEAKSWCSEAFDLVASETIQLHGGIAITWEHDAHLFFKRAHATSQLFGRAADHRRTLAPA